MNKSISLLLQLLIFFPATFAFMVLIEYGPRDFSTNAAIEWQELVGATSGGEPQN